MGIEFQAKFDTPLSDESLRDLKVKLLRESSGRIVREIEDEIDIQLNESDAIKEWEDVTIRFTRHDFYVLFSAASRDQRDVIVNYCQNALESLGLANRLEEL